MNSLLENESILKKILKQMASVTKIEMKLLENEKDPVQKAEVMLRIQRKGVEILLNNIKSCSDNEFKKWMEEISQSFQPDNYRILEQFSDMVFNASTNPKEYEKYKKIEKINQQYYSKIINDIFSASLNKKQLERYLYILIGEQIQHGFQNMETTLDNNELIRATNLVQRRFGFDHNWFMCLGSIQLYENLVKKKIAYLGESTKNKKHDELIPLLIKLIKEKENRDISLQLRMFKGIKEVRNVITHEGYNHSITKSDLKKIIREIEKLDFLLFQEKSSIFDS
ncbi:MAG: hypothetical protein OEL81_03845 [Nitrosopumilus sp.]|nr:hypothetical protein [Nitrosopumilus sp.]